MLTIPDADTLRQPFPEASIESKTIRGNTLSYISHAVVTRRILEVDPEFCLSPIFDEHGRAIEDRDENGIPTGFWCSLTIKGVTKYGYGSYTPPIPAASLKNIQEGLAKWSDSMDPDWRKKVLSDGLSTAAMRFGIALQLWDKTTDNAGNNLKKTLSPYAEELKTKFMAADDDVKAAIKAELTLKGFSRISELDEVQQKQLLTDYFD